MNISGLYVFPGGSFEGKIAVIGFTGFDYKDVIALFSPYIYICG